MSGHFLLIQEDFFLIKSTKSNHDTKEKYTDLIKHTLNGDTKISLVLSCRVGDHTGVLALMGKHGILYEEVVATLLNASIEVSSQQLKTKKIHKEILLLAICENHFFISLNGNLTDCTHLSLFAGLGEYYCICDKLPKVTSKH